ncbi:endonuclease V isoform X6 [Homo sapiens]|uniref:endonuclease V isoform X6 n=1 Tax=Homo sapiens TaxID=9606 RepID=UPI0005D03A70|nr:endonuclease V isoform X6 [Homo sapiens]
MGAEPKGCHVPTHMLVPALAGHRRGKRKLGGAGNDRRAAVSQHASEVLTLALTVSERRRLPPRPCTQDIGHRGLSPRSAWDLDLVSPALCLSTDLCSLREAFGFGVACHLGVLTDLPCVGVAKKLLQVDGLENNALHKEKIRLLQTRGDSFPLLGDSGTVLGMPTGQPSPSLSQALRSHDRSTRPLYISVGHRMSLEAAVRLTCCCCRFRIPEPVRQVHLLLCSRRSWESTDGVSVGLLSPWLRAGPSWWPHGHRRCGAPGCQVQALLPGQAGPLQGKADICSREHIRKSLGLPGPPTPRSPKAQRPVACPKGDSGESSAAGGAPSPQRQADRTTPGGRRSTAQHQVGQR